MQRRKWIQLAGAAALSSLGIGLVGQKQSAVAQSGGLSIRALGHTCFLFSGAGRSILVNPFRSIGCTQGYPTPQVSADLILLSSHLFDEGFVPSALQSVEQLREPGTYERGSLKVQGIGMPHDRRNGRQFGRNVAWVWEQAGVRVVHLGGAAAPISIEDKILIGRPDVLLVPVGGNVKAYNAQEAKAAVDSLNPKMVIPTHYRTQAADAEACDIEAIDAFLSLMSGVPVSRPGATTTVAVGQLSSSGRRITILNAPGS